MRSPEPCILASRSRCLNSQGGSGFFVRPQCPPLCLGFSFGLLEHLRLRGVLPIPPREPVVNHLEVDVSVAGQFDTGLASGFSAADLTADLRRSQSGRARYATSEKKIADNPSSGPRVSASPAKRNMHATDGTKQIRRRVTRDCCRIASAVQKSGSLLCDKIPYPITETRTTMAMTVSRSMPPILPRREEGGKASCVT